MSGGARPHNSSSSGLRVWLPAALLIVVAVIQIVLAKTADLSPWKGGGFGMFATIDGSASRQARIFVEAPNRSEQLDIARSQEILAGQASLFPSDSNLRNLAIAVAEREQRYGRPVTTVRIEIWRAEFNEHLEATDRNLRTLTWQNVDRTPDSSR